MYLKSRAEFSEHFGDEEYFLQHHDENAQLRPPTLVIALDDESRAACVAMSKSRVEPTEAHKKRATSDIRDTTLWIESRDRMGPIEFENSMYSFIPVPHNPSLFPFNKKHNFIQVAAWIMRDYTRYVRADRFVVTKPDNARDVIQRDAFTRHLAERFSDSQVLRSVWKNFVNTTVMDDFILSSFSNETSLLCRSCAFDLEIFQHEKFASSSHMSMFRELHHGCFERCTWLWRLQLGSRVLVQRRLGILESASIELVKLLRWIGLSLSHASEKLLEHVSSMPPTRSFNINYPLQDFKSILDKDSTLTRVDEIAFALGLRVGDVVNVETSIPTKEHSERHFLNSFRFDNHRPIRIGVVVNGSEPSTEGTATTMMIRHIRSTTQVIRAMAKCTAKLYRESVSRHAALVGWIKSRHHMSAKHVSDLMGCMILQREYCPLRESSVHVSKKMGLERRTASEKVTSIQRRLETLDNDLVSTRCEHEMKFLKAKVNSFLFEGSKSTHMFTQTLDECKSLQAILCSYRQPIILSSSSNSFRHIIHKIHENSRARSHDATSIQKRIMDLQEYDKNIIKAEMSLQKRSVRILRVASDALFECGARIHVASQSRKVVIITAYWIESPKTSTILRLSRATVNITEMLRASLYDVAPKHVPSRVSPSFQVYVVFDNLLDIISLNLSDHSQKKNRKHAKQTTDTD